MTEPGWRTLRELEVDYLKDLLLRWRSYSYVAAGVGLVLGIIAASMHGYMMHGFAMVGPAISYGLAAVLAGGGVLICGVLQVVARRLKRDLDLLRADELRGEARAAAEGRYVRLDLGGERFLLERAAWDRAGLKLGAMECRLEHTPVGRVVLTVNGSAVYEVPRG